MAYWSAFIKIHRNNNTVSSVSYCFDNNNIFTWQEISFGVLDATDGLLPGIKDVIEKVFLPAILETSNWGDLGQSKEDTKHKQKFVETIKKYISFLGGKLCI